MSLANLKAAASGKYELHDALLVRAGKPIMNWQTLTIKDTSEFEMSTYYDPALPDLVVSQDQVGKWWEFRVKSYKNGNFINLRGHINGPIKKGHEHG